MRRLGLPPGQEEGGNGESPSLSSIRAIRSSIHCCSNSRIASSHIDRDRRCSTPSRRASGEGSRAMRSRILGCTTQSFSYSSTHSAYVRSAIAPSRRVGEIHFSRRDKALGRRTGSLFHRAPRAGCLTGLRAGTLVSAVYAEAFALRNHAPHSLPLATLGSQRPR